MKRITDMSVAEYQRLAKRLDQRFSADKSWNELPVQHAPRERRSPQQLVIFPQLHMNPRMNCPEPGWCLALPGEFTPRIGALLLDRNSRVQEPMAAAAK
jgi:hypothetical protein